MGLASEFKKSLTLSPLQTLLLKDKILIFRMAKKNYCRKCNVCKGKQNKRNLTLMKALGENVSNFVHFILSVLR